MSYESTPEDTRRAWVLALIYVALVVLSALMLFKIWPPTPWPMDQDFQNNALARAFNECGYPIPTPVPAPTASPASGNENASPNPPAAMPIKLIGKMCLNTTFDERLILLVIVAGVLGSFIHGATSIADYIGNNNFNRNWSWFYILRPFIGMALALVFYFVIRAGFLTTSGGAKDINPYGIAALAGLVGMFSKQATDKLGEVFGTLFRAAPGEGDDKRKDSLAAEGSPTILNIEPDQLALGIQGQTIAVTGTRFSDGSTVYLDEEAQETTFESPTKLSARINDVFAAKTGTVKLKVVNPDNTVSKEIDVIVV